MVADTGRGPALDVHAEFADLGPQEQIEHGAQGQDRNTHNGPFYQRTALDCLSLTAARAASRSRVRLLTWVSSCATCPRAPSSVASRSRNDFARSESLKKSPEGARVHKQNSQRSARPVAPGWGTGTGSGMGSGEGFGGNGSGTTRRGYWNSLPVSTEFCAIPLRSARGFTLPREGVIVPRSSTYHVLRPVVGSGVSG